LIKLSFVWRETLVLFCLARNTFCKCFAPNKLSTAFLINKYVYRLDFTIYCRIAVILPHLLPDYSAIAGFNNPAMKLDYLWITEIAQY